jgi:hypothetical protein
MAAPPLSAWSGRDAARSVRVPAVQALPITYALVWMMRGVTLNLACGRSRSSAALATSNIPGGKT